MSKKVPKTHAATASEAKGRPQRSLIFVLGMHRSGTSALTRVLNLAGLALPEKLMEARPDNERGFWEPLELVEANDRFLRELGLAHDTVATLPDGFENHPAAKYLRAEIERVLDAVPGRAPIVIKDPRLCRLMPIWRPTVEDAGFSVKIVAISRNPLEVARSLEERSNFSREKSLWLWLLYNLDLERHTRGLPRVFTTYSGLLTNWEDEVVRVKKALRVPSLKIEDETRAQVEAFLSGDLRHHSIAEDEVFDHPNVSEWIKSMASGLSSASRGDVEALQEASYRIYDRVGAAINEIGNAVATKDSQIYDLTQALHAAQAERDALDAEAGDLRAEVSSIRDARNERIDALQSELSQAEKARREAAEQLDALLAERSTLQSELAQTRAENADLYAERDTLEGALDTQHHNAGRLQMELTKLHSMVEAVQAAADRQGIPFDELPVQLDALTQDVARYQIEIERAQSIGAELAEQASRNREQNDQLAAALRASQERLHALTAEAAGLRSELEAKQGQLAEALSALETERSDRAYERDQLQSQLETERGDRAYERDQLQSRLEDAQSRINAMTGDLETEQRERASERSQLKSELESAAYMAQAREAELNAVHDQAEQLRADKARLDAELKAAHSDLAARSSELDRVSEQAARADAEEEQRHEWERRAEWLASELQGRRGVGFSLSRGLMKRGRIGRALAMASGLYAPDLVVRPRRLAHLLRQGEALRASPYFDAEYYVASNWDVRMSGADPVMHYLLFGAAEGRNPSEQFDTAFYQNRHADVRESGLNPLYHFIRYGQAEGRFASPQHLPADPVAEIADSRDPYSIRADEIVYPEIDRGKRFLERHGLLGDTPDFAAAVTELEHGDRSLPVARHDETPDVSIIIPVYGQLAYTLNCLDSLRGHESGRRCEIIVVDDGSPDETAAFLPELSWVRYVRTPQNLGFIGACNTGGAQARGDYVVLLNNDTRVVPGWLDELVGTFEHHEACGLAGSKLFSDDGSLQEAGGIIWRDGRAWNYGRDQDPNKPEFCYARRTDYCSGASIALPRALWRELGGFDGETYDRAYCEDSDLAFRVRAAGRETWFQPLSRVVHYEGKTSGTDTAQGEKAYQVTNQARLLEKWRPVIERHGENAQNPYGEADRGPDRIALVLDELSPEPWRDAGSVTVVSTIRALQHLGYRVVFAAQDNLLYERLAAENLQRMGVEVLHLPFTESVESYVRARSAQIQLVHFFRYKVVNAELEGVRRWAPHAVTTFNVMDLHHVRVRRQAEIAGDRALLRHAEEEIRPDEMRAAANVDTTFVHTVPERDIVLSERPDANVRLYPYVTDETGRDGGFDSRAGVMFLGGFGHSPNIDAVEFFVGEVMPHLRTRLPGVAFHIAGSKVNARIKALAGPDVIVDGFVPSLRAYFSKFRVMVAPLRFGAGIKGKVAAALVHGVPSVVSTVAAEGMELADGEAAFVRDDPEAIAEAVASVYGDSARWTSMSDAALKFGMANYSLDAACKAFASALDDHHAARPGQAV